VLATERLAIVSRSSQEHPRRRRAGDSLYAFADSGCRGLSTAIMFAIMSHIIKIRLRFKLGDAYEAE